VIKKSFSPWKIEQQYFLDQNGRPVGNRSQQKFWADFFSKL